MPPRAVEVDPGVLVARGLAGPVLVEVVLVEVVLVEAVVGDMDGVSEDAIKKRQIRHWFKADPGIGRRLAEGLGFEPESIIADELLAVEDEIDHIQAGTHVIVWAPWQGVLLRR